MCQPSSNSNPQVLRRQKKRKVDLQMDFFKACTATLQANNQPMTEYDAVSVNISKKLAKMEAHQAIFAESLIGSILRRGLLNKLTEDTDLCDNNCSKTVIEGAQLLQYNNQSCDQQTSTSTTPFPELNAAKVFTEAGSSVSSFYQSFVSDETLN